VKTCDGWTTSVRTPEARRAARERMRIVREKRLLAREAAA
jgi:hypothetical protein